MAKVISVKKSIVLEIDDDEGQALYDVLEHLKEEVNGVTYLRRFEDDKTLSSLKCLLKRYYDDDLPF